MIRKSAAAGEGLLTGPGRKFAWNLIPPLVVGAVLTMVFVRAELIDQLPGAWGGLLFGVGATWLDTEFSLPQRPGETFTLPRASENIYSAYLGYEQGGLSARLSLANRSEYLDEIGDSPDYDIYVAENTQLDLSLSYDFSRNWSVYFEASNLLDEPLELYQGNASRTLQLEEYGRSYALGLRVNL